MVKLAIFEAASEAFWGRVGLFWGRFGLLGPANKGT